MVTHRELLADWAMRAALGGWIVGWDCIVGAQCDPWRLGRLRLRSELGTAPGRQAGAERSFTGTVQAVQRGAEWQTQHGCESGLCRLGLQGPTGRK